MTAGAQAMDALDVQRDAASAPSNRGIGKAVDKCGTSTRGQSGDDSIPGPKRLTRDLDTVGDVKRVAKRLPRGRCSRRTPCPLRALHGVADYAGCPLPRASLRDHDRLVVVPRRPAGGRVPRRRAGLGRARGAPHAHQR